MAKTQSLAASFRNITQYLSLIERARNTIQGIEAKLTELDRTVSEAAGLIDNDDYNSVSVEPLRRQHLRYLKWLRGYCCFA